MIRLAKFSDDKTKRFYLLRVWDESDPVVMCIGLNPSKADDIKDDLTIRILTNKLMELGFGGFYMCNLWTWITPNPKELFEKESSKFESDLLWLTDMQERVSEVIFCWGAFRNIEWRAKKVIAAFPRGKCFGKNPDGSPWHPRRMQYMKNHKPELISFV